MSTTGIIGTLDIYLDDGAGEQLVASIRQAVLRVQTQMRRAFSPSGTASQSYITGTQNWTAEGSVLQLADVDTLVRESYLILIENAAVDGTLLTVRFVSPTGAEYDSEAYIDTFEVGGAESDGYAGSFSVQGAAELVLTEGE